MNQSERLAERDLLRTKTIICICLWFDEMLFTNNFDKTKFIEFSCNES